MQTTRRGFLGTAAALSLSGCLGSTSEPTLTVGVVPDVDPDTAIEQNTALASHLEAELDATVDLRTAADYAGMVQAMVAGQVDLAYYGGVSYVLAHHRAGAEPVVVGSKDGETLWHSAFVVGADADAEGMDDVAANVGDLDLVFGDPISTSGTVMPTYYLQTEHDLAPQTAFDQVTHVGAHDATAKTVAGSTGTVGALNARIYDALVDDDAVTDIREIWRTPGFPDYPWAVSPSMEAATTEEVRRAFTSLDSTEDADILDQQNVDRYVEVSHDDFASLDDAVEMAGIETGTETGASG
ncbi:phosphate/phosphite/phosphonate ABC transporter substrate-binding protein (plasmid) [Haloarcula salina]|uniref:phosphate/phosphite/phosphonate ABC transporter substrate-binding protein n=1 Tax=Haloarcula salina TaxID=1429914 RepID=UPI003C6FF2FA